MDIDDNLPPILNSPAAVPQQVSPATFNLHRSTLTTLLNECIIQIGNIHTIFSGNYKKKDQPVVKIADIERTLQILLDPIFIPYFNVPAKKFTPDCKKSLGTHLKDIAGDSPNTFTKKDSRNFLQSVDQKDFYTFFTHEKNTFFIQRMLIDPEYGFALFRNITLINEIDPQTLQLIPSISHGEYNVVKLLNAKNPETHSGPSHLHHVYQNSEVVTIVPYSEHKEKTKAYHKSNKDSKIDRQSCATEFYYIKKLLGLLQVSLMCAKVLENLEGLSIDVTGNMQYITAYTGNIDIIPNSISTTQRYTIEAILTEQDDSTGGSSSNDNLNNRPASLSSSSSSSSSSGGEVSSNYRANRRILKTHAKTFLEKIKKTRSKSSGSSSSSSGTTTSEDDDSENELEILKKMDLKKTPPQFKTGKENQNANSAYGEYFDSLCGDESADEL